MTSPTNSRPRNEVPVPADSGTNQVATAVLEPPFLNGMSSAHLDLMLPGAMLVDFHPGDLVFKQGDPSPFGRAYPDAGDDGVQKPQGSFAVQRFVELMRRLDARPKAHVAYLREADVHPDHDEVRVTFDCNVEFSLQAGAPSLLSRPLL